MRKAFSPLALSYLSHLSHLKTTNPPRRRESGTFGQRCSATILAPARERARMCGPRNR